MKKYLFLTALIVTFSFTFILVSSPFAQTKKKYRIGIATMATHPALDQAKQGFIDALAKAGFKEGENVEYMKDNAERDMSLAASIAKKYVSQKVDMIVSITTPISQACVAAAKGTDIPIIFNSVTDPVAAKLVDSWEKPGGNVTGASDWNDVEQQIALIKKICPKVKKLGIMYNSGEDNSVVQVAEVKKYYKKLGIKKIVEATVGSTADVALTAKSLVGRVDAIWFPTDNMVVAGLEAIVKVGEDNNLPIFGSDPTQADRGAIAGNGVNMYEVGYESGKMAALVLQKKKKPADIAITKGIMSKMTINVGAAKRMGIKKIPASLLKEATKVIN